MAWLEFAAAAAEIDPGLIEMLKFQIETLGARVRKLESQPQSPMQKESSDRVARVPVHQSAASWIERIDLKGDLRIRYENIDDTKEITERNRHRVRARVEISAQVNDRWSAELGMASGSMDPRSANQTLGGGATTKGLGLDLAYVSFAANENLTLASGKIKNPLHRVGGYHLVWDSDYRPEGFALKYENGALWANAMIHFLESDNDSGASDVETIYAIQGGTSHALTDDIDFQAGAGYYQIGTRGSTPFYRNEPAGNSVAEDGRYLFDYQELEVFAEFSSTLADWPVRAFIDYVVNLDTEDEATAWALGLQLGKVGETGTWQIAYRYQNLEADALYGAIIDSDFAEGRTGNRGHVIQASMAFHKDVRFGLKYMISEYGEQNSESHFDYDRLQLDLALKF